MLKWIAAGAAVWWAMPQRKRRQVKRIVKKAQKHVQENVQLLLADGDEE